ncbi:DUF262 domain-containing protein [Ralstonia solanacearum]|uniref:GmrSD restriction endonucleases N-terminal domain-containing protein n=1 Tax=Ralstonia solanacearum TaxID=305 RepID=A0AAD0S990_RALSL|nr:DUF262 domain-containing protein [Ralstonia solanacearum]AXV83158.1 hypothetical protein CJO77_10865 [Ralstonia solanacearum]AXW54285.1 hypothetical protein CJO92_10860 [Ralstonia solanacearum]
MLQQEIEASQRKVRTDAYQMSIGEIVSMYKEGDLIIDPEFQRLFRWEPGQKSKLIESLLLGIPLPPIFVFEKEDAKWELIDGLQRMSTILEFMGLLKDPDNGTRPPSYLEATKYLPSLNNVVWEKTDRIPDLDIDDQNELDKALQLTIRRARIGVEILKRPSDNHTKYDLFQRLNSSGTPANPQELRNCVIIMVNAPYFARVKKMAESASFLEVINATEEQKERQRHLEYASRFLTHTFVPYDGNLDVEEFIDDSMQSLAEQNAPERQARIFKWTFDLLQKIAGGDALRRLENNRPTGRIGLAAFECIAIGVGRNYTAIRALPNSDIFVRKKIEQFWESPDIDRFFAAGLRGTVRIQRTIPFGERWFKP